MTLHMDVRVKQNLKAHRRLLRFCAHPSATRINKSLLLCRSHWKLCTCSMTSWGRAHVKSMCCVLLRTPLVWPVDTLVAVWQSHIVKELHLKRIESLYPPCWETLLTIDDAFNITTASNSSSDQRRHGLQLNLQAKGNICCTWHISKTSNAVAWTLRRWKSIMLKAPSAMLEMCVEKKTWADRWGVMSLNCPRLPINFGSMRLLAAGTILIPNWALIDSTSSKWTKQRGVERGKWPPHWPLFDVQPTSWHDDWIDPCTLDPTTSSWTLNC